MSSKYLPANCIWKDLDDEQTNQVITEFDLSSMRSKSARVNFDDDDNDCSIKICDNVKINDEPFYLLTCNPVYGNKLTKLLLKKEQREILAKLNPYSNNYDRMLESPVSISKSLSPVPFNAGSKKKYSKKYSKKYNKKI